MTEQVRYGLVGTGMMGVEHLSNLAVTPGAVVTAIADPVETSLGWAQGALGRHGGRACAEFADSAALADERAGRCGDRRHRPISRTARCWSRCSTQGCAILCEKPLATTIADARWIVEQRRRASARRSGPRWNIATCRPPPNSSREVHGGKIGRLRMLSIREHRFPFLPKVGDWNRFSANTGGTMVEKCCHFFDLMRLIDAVARRCGSIARARWT